MILVVTARQHPQGNCQSPTVSNGTIEWMVFRQKNRLVGYVWMFQTQGS